MTREQEQTWLIIAGVIVAHAAGLFVLLFSYSGGGPVGDAATGVSFAMPTEERVPPTALAPEPEVRTPPPMPSDMHTSVGETAGIGEAISSVDLEASQRSPSTHEIEQAWTRQRPSFVPPSVASRTAVAGTTPDTERPARQPFGPLRPVEGLMSIPSPRKAQDQEPSEPTVEIAERPADAAPGVSPTDGQASESSPPQANVNASDETAAPAGESDLDPFAKEEGVDFTAGGMSARSGREVKLVRPHVDFAFMADATRIGGRSLSVACRIVTDASGRPREVEVVRSSGSAQIDNAVRLALFDSWFGGTMPDAFVFTVAFIRSR